MEIVLYIGAFLFAGLFIFLFIEKPYYLSGILIFMMVYRFNLAVPGPLDARGLLLVLLFSRVILFDKTNMQTIFNYLFRNKYFWQIFLFTIIILVVSLLRLQTFKLPLKEFILAIVSITYGFIVVLDKEGQKTFLYAIIVAGLVSVFDLGLHYYATGAISGRLTLIRPLDLLMVRKKITVNHNFPGLLSGVAFAFVYYKYNKEQWGKIVAYPLLFLLGSGIFMSTSRSTLLAVIFVLFFINITGKKKIHSFKKIFLIFISVFILYASFYFIYINFLYKHGAKTNILTTIYYRLYEEPAQIFGSKQKFYDKYSNNSKEGSINFRIRKAKHDLDKFTDRDFIDQMFGLGDNGYKEIGQKRFIENGKYSYLLDAHNGLTMILVETGFVGLFIFLFLSFSLIIKLMKLYNKYNYNLPIMYLYALLFIYTLGQNGELRSSLSFLLIGGMIGNLFEHELNVEDEEETDLSEEESEVKPHKLLGQL